RNQGALDLVGIEGIAISRWDQDGGRPQKSKMLIARPEGNHGRGVVLPGHIETDPDRNPNWNLLGSSSSIPFSFDDSRSTGARGSITGQARPVLGGHDRILALAGQRLHAHSAERVGRLDHG